MALTVETGSVVAGAESYLSVADSDSYFNGHGNPSEWTTATTAEKEAALRYATQYLDATFSWFSHIKDKTQELDWPRKEYEDSEGRTWGGDTIPQALKNATAEMALQHIKQNLNDEVEKGRSIKSQTAGSSSVSYFQGAGNREFQYIKKQLRHLGVTKAKINTTFRA